MPTIREVHNWHTKIELEGINGKFNSVYFTHFLFLHRTPSGSFSVRNYRWVHTACFKYDTTAPATQEK